MIWDGCRSYTCNIFRGENMKKNSLCLALLLVLLGGFAILASGQNRVLGQANIPFNFVASGEQLSAGNYELWQIGIDSVRLQNVATSKGVTLHLPANIADNHDTKFVFHRYGSSAFLAAVATPSDEMSLPPSHAEKEFAVTKADVKTVALQIKH